MAIIQLKVKNIMNLGLWDKLCEYKGWNPYILNEGQIDEETIIEFDDEFKKELVIEDIDLEKLIEDVSSLEGEEEVINGAILAIETLRKYDSILESLKDEWKGYTHFHGQDGHDACLVMEIVEKFKIQ